jgi:hypothetical protein
MRADDAPHANVIAPPNSWAISGDQITAFLDVISL